MNILVVGGSRGLGVALVEYGLKQGHRVFATIRNSNAYISRLREQYESLQFIEWDVTDEAAIKQTASELEQKGISFDVIINNAAILNERDNDIEHLDLEATLQAFNINTLGPVRVIKHFLKLIKKNKQSLIVNISSEAGSITNTYAGDYAYGLSKVALNLFTEKLALALKEEDIEVLSIHPGWMHTDMGGKQAPLDPNQTAAAIYQLMSARPTLKDQLHFIDYQGKPMDI
ncbi:NAD(P)-dependent dehydrogenase, short-chain alcohol dehydrogenase family [Amphibacillus marinus]|uniref:NAD(P)-dependent dehydrogenase, short-chain alcohol dehydrogenase family n=2 Tax=Amphibacillus marinus TaxID=872970 RepID=A0A1H8H8Y8_9BACI|nr:NAD(P)-dependent dehydrogenase, short-chain alcohol dehydrogenase family [Amphibacillus marinus]